MPENSGQVYLRPCGLLSGSTAPAAVQAGRAGVLAGGHLAFTMAEIITRKGTGSTSGRSSRLVSYEALAASSEPALTGLLRHICRPRPALAGLDLATPHIMGIINATPDSFSDGGNLAGPDEAIALGRKLARAGASILDVGGESTRPGAREITIEEELSRIEPVVKGLSGHGLRVSIDTRKPHIMRAAVSAGARIINDVTALSFDPQSINTAKDLQKPVILMHSKGDPGTMQNNPEYDDVLLDVYDGLQAKITACEENGIGRARIMADPGIGFGKTFHHNLAILHGLTLFHGLGTGLALGVSRKAFIGALTGQPVAARRATGSVAAGLHALMQGAQILRVHDVEETKQALAVWNAIQQPDFASL